MKHTQYKEWLQLSMYDELSDDEKVLLAGHLKTCAECKAEAAELKSLHATLARHKPVQSIKEILRDARAELRVAIRLERTKRSWFETVSEYVSAMLTPQVKVAFTGVALLALGVGLGYFVLRPPVQDQAVGFHLASDGTRPALEQGEAQIANVRFINRDAASGSIEFTFDAVTPVSIKGNVFDDRIQRILARAVVSEQNPGMRLRAVSAISGQSDRQQPMNNEIKTALIAALKFDSNRGVRQEALKALQKYLPDPEATQAILYVLSHEKNTGMKIAAINSFEMSKFEGQPGKEELLNGLRDRVQSDENNYIRIRAKAALQEAK